MKMQSIVGILVLSCLSTRGIAVHTRIVCPPTSLRSTVVRCQDDGSSSYDRTSSPVRALVAGLTRLVGGDVSADAVLAPPRPGTVTPQELLDGVRADYVDRLYLWTGDIDPEMYDDDCIFTDPTLSFRGLATFQKNLEALQPFLKALVREPAIDLYSCKLDEDACRVQAVWRMRGDLALPWRPAINLKGRTVRRQDPHPRPHPLTSSLSFHCTLSSLTGARSNPILTSDLQVRARAWRPNRRIRGGVAARRG